MVKNLRTTKNNESLEQVNLKESSAENRSSNNIEASENNSSSSGR